MQGRILVDEAASSITRMVLLSPLLPLPSLHFLRNEARTLQSQRICRLQEKLIVCSSPSTKPISKNGIWRRDLLLFGLSSSVSLVFPSSGSLAEEDLKMASMTDDINAYSYLYPVEWPSKKFLFKWVESRKPERYSSAAPLSPDARLRIVSERVDIIDNLIISVSIGPPNLQILKSKEKSSWKAKDVVDSVLADKSALVIVNVPILRVTSSQRMEESSVLDAHDEEIDGDSYWYYEYLVRKSPSNLAQEANLYRHYVASTAERDGYLYSINASTLSKQWDKMGPFLERTVASFRLLPPTDNYVPPYKDPWRFW